MNSPNMLSALGIVNMRSYSTTLALELLRYEYIITKTVIAKSNCFTEKCR